MPRLAPGDDESTRRALEMIYGAGLECIGEGFRVLDIGCGNGAQTLRLAAELGCKVTAVDNHQPYLDGRFTLTESSWWEPYYGPLAERLAGYEAPSEDDETQAVLGMIRSEIGVYKRFSRWYGYVFFLLRTRS